MDTLAAGRPRSLKYQEIVETARSLIIRSRNLGIHLTQKMFCGETGITVSQLHSAQRVIGKCWSDIIDEAIAYNDEIALRPLFVLRNRESNLPTFKEVLRSLLSTGFPFESTWRLQKHTVEVLKTHPDVPKSEAYFMAVVEELLSERFTERKRDTCEQANYENALLFARHHYRSVRSSADTDQA